jgi:hypothetical protein
MATNLVSLVMQFLTPDMIERIGSAVEVDRNKIQPAVGSAVPALLAAFNNTATQPGGSQKLADAARQHANAPRNLARALVNGEQSSLFDDGSRILLSLVGSQNQNVLTEAIAEFTGLSQGATGSLLAMLAPIIMGTIAQHQRHDLDASGITALFASQKDNIAAALPPGFGKLFSVLGDLPGQQPQ